MKRYILSKPFLIGAAATVVMSGIGGYVWKEEHRPHVLEIYVFALKSGRSIFVRTPEDRRILIDGGANSEVISKLTNILPFYSRHIDIVVATNTDGKNVSGLIDVLKRYRVSEAYIPAITSESIGGATSSDQIYKTFVQTLHDLKIDTRELFAGDTINFDPNVIGGVLFPVKDFEYSKASAPEIVMNISYRSTSVALFGSVSTKIQKFLGNIDHSDVLVISNNPSPANLTYQLIDMLKPKCIVYSKSISAKQRPNTSSKNKKVPDPLASILVENRFNIQEKGTIKIVSDGKTVSVH